MSIKIALVRHGDAPFHVIDSQRQLSKKGQEEAHNTALYLKEISFPTKTIIHSGLDRARDTAEIIREELAPQLHCEISEDLRPESNLSPWENNLIAWKEGHDAIIVSHMPFLPMLLEELTGKRTAFPTAGCVIIEKEEGELHWKLVQANF